MDKPYMTVHATIGFTPETRERIERLRDEFAIGGKRPSLATITRELLMMGLERAQNEGLRPRL